MKTLKFNFSCPPSPPPPPLNILTVYVSTLKQSFIEAFYIRTSKQVLREYFEAVISRCKNDEKLVIFTPDYYSREEVNIVILRLLAK